HIGLGLGQFPADIGDEDLVRGLRPLQVLGPAAQFLQGGDAGMCLALVCQLGQARVDGLYVQQAQLGCCGGCCHGVPPVSAAPSLMVHGSVTRVLTMVSSRPPESVSRPRAATGSHGHSLAQCASSMRSGAPSSERASSARSWRRSAVTYTSATEACAAPRYASPAPPHTATVCTMRSRSPLTRMPCAVAGSVAATCPANSRSVISSASCPMRPLPVGADGARVARKEKAGSSYVCTSRSTAVTWSRNCGGTTISIRRSATRSCSPICPMAGSAPSCGVNSPTPATDQAQPV